MTGKVAETLSEVLDDVCTKRGFAILSKEIQPDHVHFFVSIPPAVSVAEAVKIFKGASARTLFVRHPELKSSCGTAIYGLLRIMLELRVMSAQKR